MEFAVSNFLIDSFQDLGNGIYYKGQYQNYGKIFVFSDGYTLDDIDVFKRYESLEVNHDDQGLFNLVYYDQTNEVIKIKNDKVGKIPLYYYCENGKFIISNNVWNIISSIASDDIIDIDVIKSLLFLVTIPHETNTIFKGIKRFPNGSIGYLSKSGLLRIERYYTFEYTPDYSLKIEEEASLLNEDFIRLFTKIKENHPNEIMGFGNSGGFDSRLIAYYANKLEIPSVAYVVGNSKPFKILNSTTKYLAEKIADHFELESKWIEYSSNNMFENMLLDIRNNPFHSTQLFKNPVDQISFFDFEITGQPGSFAKGLPKSIVEGSRDDLIQFSIETYSYLQDTLKGSKNNKKRSAKHLGLAFEYGFDDSYLSEFFNQEEYNKQIHKVTDCYKNYTHLSQFNAWENFNERTIIKSDYCGGYESFCRTKKSYYIYYPYFYERMKFWPEHFSYDRKMLQVLFKQLSPFLTKIPGQDFQPASNQNIMASYVKKVEMALRGRGLNFDYMLKRNAYKTFSEDILNRKNPLFDEIINTSVLMKSKLMNTVCGMNILKLKLLLDIVYYKEFSLLFNAKYEIV
jgi:asparagine synthase (glutamine-hydrolysing)